MASAVPPGAYAYNQKRVSRQIARAYRYGCCVPLAPLTRKQFENVIAWSGVYLGFVEMLPSDKRRLR